MEIDRFKAYAVPMHDDADLHNVSLHQNGKSAPDADITIHDEPQEFQLQANVSLDEAEAPACAAEEAPPVSAPDVERTPAMQENGASNDAKKKFLDALKKCSNDWLKDHSERSQQIGKLLKHIYSKVEVTKRTKNALFVPNAIEKKLKSYLLVKFRYGPDDDTFELTFNDPLQTKVYKYKDLAKEHIVFIDGSEHIVKFRISENPNDDYTVMFKMLKGELWFHPKKSKSK